MLEIETEIPITTPARTARGVRLLVVLLVAISNDEDEVQSRYGSRVILALSPRTLWQLLRSTRRLLGCQQRDPDSSASLARLWGGLVGGGWVQGACSAVPM